ncbi:MAG: DNA repair protein RecN, partial [Anaerolineales bacterium]
IELQIKNFAIIEAVTLQFDNGFNVITGETGAGKSILIDAVDFALGGRSDSSLIRAGADRATVMLMFRVPPKLRSEIRSLLERNDIAIPSLETITLTREIRESGRSSARVNDSTCKLAVYREVSGLLIDIHGQTDHLSLLEPKTHLYLLDRYADLEEPREALAELVRKLNAVRQTIRSLQQDDREREQRIDMLKFQIEEINAARLQDGEEETLREERNRLANSEKLAELCDDAYNALYGEDEFGNSGLNALNRVQIALDRLAALDDSLEDDQTLAEELAVQAEELADNIRRYREAIEVSPQRLNEVEERLEVISRLKRKYGNSIKLILSRAENAQKELDDIELGEERIEALMAEAQELLYAIGDLAQNLSKGRRRFGRKLSEAVEGELKHLRMEGARFEVAMTQEEDPEGCFVEGERLAFDMTGIDRLAFMLSANPGEPLRPLAQVASGGETARIMLALKTVLSKADQTPSLIFDEIDQGIGGRLGITVGQKLWGLSHNHQVMVVTHLAQIAGFADRHFKVSKAAHDQRTLTEVGLLEEDHRVHEMAEMLGGVSENALRNARELYDTAIQIKQKAPAD